MVDKKVYKFVVSLLKKSDDVSEKHIDIKTAQYLVDTAISIFLKKEKKTYEKNFEELRLRGVYGCLKPFVTLLEMLSYIYKNADIVSLLNSDLIDYTKMLDIIEKLEILQDTDTIKQVIVSLANGFNIPLPSHVSTHQPYKVKKYKELAVINDNKKDL